jgi:hypothetical protein
MFTPPKRTTGLLLRSPVALITQEKYGADMARLRRIFLLFGLLVAEHYTKIDRTSNSVQLWRICAVFFLFLACFCPKPDGELCCCSLPVNDGLLMIATPECIRIAVSPMRRKEKVREWSLLHPLRGL